MIRKDKLLKKIKVGDVELSLTAVGDKVELLMSQSGDLVWIDAENTSEFLKAINDLLGPNEPS